MPPFDHHAEPAASFSIAQSIVRRSTNMLYGIRERKGFVQLTGEIGRG